MITYFDYATLPVTPWKNGAGATREIIAVPSVDAPFLWRASIATLQADGPFSPFPGVDRTIVLLAGRPLRLRGRRSTIRWRSGNRGRSPANGSCPASGSLSLDWTSMS